ncbi:MAG: translation initiation factor IF-2, partial [Rikenellaceae bacterium]
AQGTGQGGQNRPYNGQNRPNTGQGGHNRPNNNKPGGANANPNHNAKRKGKAPVVKAEVTDEEVQKQIKDTLARLTSKGNKTKSSKYRRDKREAINQRINEEQERQEQERNTLKLTEFVTVSDLAKMMDVQVTEIITACMNLGLMVSINQRLDAEALVIVAEEFGYKCEFVSVEIQESIATDEDKEEDLLPRSPIVTVMGHVDHGKTSLLDFIRKSKVIEGEAGGITQHIGAYSVKIEDGRRITFLDTPGHEAFTAMRARGARVTDIAIIIIAADDSVMPQTIEAINHASAAGVPIVFAINKIDKPGANTDRIREQLGAMNYLVEEWGGKYQCQEIAAKQGLNVDLLLEKVLLEAELLELKANPNKRANGIVIESSLDKGRGYTSTVLVQAGTLKIGDTMLSGIHTGRVKAMFNERGKRVTEAAPATPVLVLGLNGAPQAGDAFNIMEDDKSARDLANKREQLQRMQGLNTQKHITLDEIGRRIAIGNFQELNVIVKGDVDGSVEALTDSLIKQSKEEVQVNVIHKAVGQISESDVLLAAASNAVIIGFQVRPSVSARRLAEKEEIEIRTYSIIYDAINEIKDAIEGMLAPQYREEIVCSVEIMETFKITKVGTIAGCLVREGKIKRDTKVRVIRDGIVVYTGKLASLKRYKDDAKEVVSGLECGLNIENYNDIHVGDIVEGYDQIEIKRK